MTESTHRLPRRRQDAPVVLAGDATDAGEVELNATAFAIWELCDGATTVEEMIEAAQALFEAPDDDIEADVRKIVRKLDKHDLITWSDEPPRA